MPDSGTDLGADLYGLYKIANANLPDVANEYMSAAGHVGATGSGLAAAFTRSSQLGGPHGRAYGPWVELRDTIKRFLSDTDDNLKDTAHALLLAVDAYAESDRAAEDELNRLKTDNPVR